MSRETLDNVWLSVQGSMEDCLRVDGDNTYPLRHMVKVRLQRQGILPVSPLKCKPELICHGRQLLAAPVAIGMKKLGNVPSPGAIQRVHPFGRREY